MKWPVAWRAAALVGLCTACASGPAVQPFRGPPPRTIAILPLIASDLPASLRRTLDDQVHRHVADRGYAVIAAGVVGDVMPDEAAAAREFMVKLRRDFDADAVLERRGGLDPGMTSRGFHVQWTLRSTDDGSVLWTRREHAVPGAVVSRHLTGPSGRYEPDPFFSDEPIAGRGAPDWNTAVRIRSPADQVVAVQRALASRLPRARRDG